MILAFFFFIIPMSSASEITHYNVELIVTSSENVEDINKSYYKVSREKLSENAYKEIITMPNVPKPLTKTLVSVSGKPGVWVEEISLNSEVVMSSQVHVSDEKQGQWMKWRVVRKPFVCGDGKSKCKEGIQFETKADGKIVGAGKRVSVDPSIKEFKMIKMVMTPTK